MQTPSTEVLIVGAGPTGLTMACELLRRGVPCRILEKAATPATTSRAIGLQARSLELFANMGIVDSALAQGIPGIRVNAYSDDHLAFRLDFRFLANESIPYPYGTLLPQNLTEQILLDLLRKLGGQVERSREVIGFQQTHERVTVTVNHLEDGSSEEIDAGWLIGCDGVHSHIRKASGIAFEGSAYQEEFLLGDVDLDWDKSHEEVHVWLHQDGQFGAMPLPDNHWRLVADMPVTPGKTIPLASPELFERLLRERAGDSKTRLSHPTWMSNFQIHRRLAASYRQNRVFLAGDAAHVHSPFGGQGANTGIQDAFNLAWKLALVIHGKAADMLLDTYQEERRPVARQVLEETHQLTSIFYQRNLLMRMIRDRVVIPLLKRPGIQRRLLWEASELGIQYRSSTLSSTHQRRLQALLSGTKKVPQAGDRAPDGRCLRLPAREETTLFQVFQDPRAHLLLFDGSIQTSSTYTHLLQLAQHIEFLFKEEIQVHLVASSERALAWEGSLLCDVNHRVHAHYGIRVPSFAFIRPDGYIGLLCPLTHDQELVVYLQRLYLFPHLGSAESQAGLAGEAKIS
jgi:2-polyprenyl-6-methoxyphenol hydroxylase-like FAD-dependent oxidoreductase